MQSSTQNIETLNDIRRIMERSSRFISLSGWSGVAAGICALIGAAVAYFKIDNYYAYEYNSPARCSECLRNELIGISIVVLVAAMVSATAFTYIKSKKEGVPIAGHAARRLMWNTIIPMIAGAFVIWRLIELKHYELVPASSLIFYGLALINGSKYTIGEVRYLGYAELILGIINLWLYKSGLICWALGFGLFHIIYGIAMWYKYDRQTSKDV